MGVFSFLYGKSVLKRLGYLDAIIESIISNSQMLTVSLKHIYEKVNKESEYQDSYESELDEYLNKDTNIEYNKTSEKNRLLLAIDFLVENGYLLFGKDKSIKLTYKGFIFNAKGGFVKDYKSKRETFILNKYSIVINIILSIIGLLIGFLIGKD